MRPDGTRVKDLPPLVAAIPYIMPKRYDAWNSITENIDEEAVKAYIRHWRREGVRLNHMSVIIAAYYRAVLDNPKLNYFVMNGKIYRRNHFCVSFVILKKQSDGVVNETALKVYLEPSDDIFSIDRKIREVIAANQHEHQSNSTDKFARFMFSVPGLPKFVVWLAYHLDKHGLLPRKIIDLSRQPHKPPHDFLPVNIVYGSPHHFLSLLSYVDNYWRIIWTSTGCCPGRSSTCRPSTPVCSSPIWPPSRPAISITTATSSVPPACSCAWASPCRTTWAET